MQNVCMLVSWVTGRSCELFHSAGSEQSACCWAENHVTNLLNEDIHVGNYGIQLYICTVILLYSADAVIYYFQQKIITLKTK